jgi:hypothetical protein
MPQGIGYPNAEDISEDPIMKDEGTPEGESPAQPKESNPVSDALKTIATFVAKMPELKQPFIAFLDSLSGVAGKGAGTPAMPNAPEAPVGAGTPASMDDMMTQMANKKKSTVKTIPEHAGKGAVPIM